MKKTVNLLLLTLTIITFSGCNNKNANTIIPLGTSIETFQELYPDINLEDAPPYGQSIGAHGQWSRAETLYGLNGKWTYQFKDDSLEWYLYNNYINEITEKNFNLSLNATRSLIEDYKTLLGEPTEESENETKFIDPYKEQHYGYDVTNARWIKDEMTIEISFTFFGGKGQYYFIVEIWTQAE